MKYLLKITDLTVTRDRGNILTDINWIILPGENWAVLGANGSGKSTLLNSIMSYVFPTRGFVYYFGEDRSPVNIWECRKRIGHVSAEYQENYHNYVSGWEVVASGCFSSNGIYQDIPAAIKAKSRGILKELDIPNLVDEAFGRMSYGERRLVMLGRALINDPLLLILDEPCTGLDLPHREFFLKRLDGLISNERSIIYVSHHSEEIPPAVDNCLLLKNGQVFYQGDKDEAFSEDILGRLYNCRVTVHRTRSGRFFTELS